MTRLVILNIIIYFLSLTVTSQDTLFLKPGPDEGKDVRVNQTSYGTANSVLFMCGEWTYYGVVAKDRSIIEFNFSSLPENIKLIKASLSLYAHEEGHSQLSGNNKSMLYRITERWLEDEVTWQDQPQYTTENAVFLPASEYSSQDYLDIDITPLFQDMLDNPDESHGFFLKMIEEEYYRALRFASSDHPNPDKWPELTVVYLDCEMPYATFDYVQDSMFFTFSAPDTNIQSWNWQFGDGYQSDLQNPVHTFLEYGTYQVCLTVSNECGTDEYCEDIEICFPCEAAFEFVSDEMTVSFTNSSSNWDSLIWDFGDGFFSFLENPIHAYTSAGKYNVCLTATNSCWQHMFCDTVDVMDSQGIDNTENNRTTIAYPNPFTENLSIVLPNTGIYEISLVDLSGKKLLHESIDTQNKVTLQTGSVPPGLYILTVRSEDRVYRQKVVKEINN